MQKNEPVEPTAVPETAATYERDKPDVAARPSQMKNSGVSTQSDQARGGPLPSGGKIAGDMKSEVPTGWDQAPNDIQEAERQRHPRPDKAGGSDPAGVQRDPTTTRSERRGTELGG